METRTTRELSARRQSTCQRDGDRGAAGRQTSERKRGCLAQTGQQALLLEKKRELPLKKPRRELPPGEKQALLLRRRRELPQYRWQELLPYTKGARRAR